MYGRKGRNLIAEQASNTRSPACSCTYASLHAGHAPCGSLPWRLQAWPRFIPRGDPGDTPRRSGVPAPEDLAEPDGL